MIKLRGIVFVFLLMLAFCANSSGKSRHHQRFKSGDKMERSYHNKDRIEIKDKWGNRKGYIMPDEHNPDRLNVYDKWGNREGSFTKDPFNPERLEFRDKFGN